jgi:hypothetical protein
MGRLARFLDITYVCSAGSCTCNAEAYIERIARRLEVTEMRLPDSLLDAGFEMNEADFEVASTPEQISLCRSLIGSIGYAATTCRFDVSYSLSVLSRYLPNVLESHGKLVQRTKRQDTVTHSLELQFRLLRCSLSHVIFLNHGPIAYKSRLQNIVTLSGAEAEFVALSDVTCEVKYLRELSRGLGYPDGAAAVRCERCASRAAGHHRVENFRTIYAGILLYFSD